MQITVKTNFLEVERRMAALREEIRRPAMARAINRTLEQASTQMTREIAAEFNVTSAYVRQRLRIKRAVARGEIELTGSLIGGRGDRRRSANIIAFVEKKTTLAQAKRRKKEGTLQQLFVKVKRRGPAKPLKGAFIGNKGRTVFEREGKARLPINPVQTIDVAQMFNTRRINAAVVRAINEKFAQIAAREIRFYTERFNRGGR